MTVADLAVFHVLRQAMTFTGSLIDEDKYGRLAEWDSWMDQLWTDGTIQGLTGFSESTERLLNPEEEATMESQPSEK